MDTKLSHIAAVAFTSGAAKGVLKAEMFAGKHEARLGKTLGLQQFGVNMVRLEPGSMSSLRHWHEAEDEFVYVLEGEPTLIDDNGAHELSSGSFAAFPAGQANAHHFSNRSNSTVVLLVVGSRKPGQEVIHYPDDPIGPIHK